MPGRADDKGASGPGTSPDGMRGRPRARPAAGSPTDSVERRPGALKLLPPSLTSDPARARRFEREARAASSLNHPNIVTAHEFGEADGLRFIVTEYVEGRTLKELARNAWVLAWDGDLVMIDLYTPRFTVSSDALAGQRKIARTSFESLRVRLG